MTDSHSFGDAVVEEFVHDGRKCLVTQHPQLGYYCGYARTSFQARYGDGRFNKINSFIEVHGGLSYGVDEDGFIGFDCDHVWDGCYSDGELITEPAHVAGKATNLWYVEDVVDEVKHLADQLTKLESFVEEYQ